MTKTWFPAGIARSCGDFRTHLSVSGEPEERMLVWFTTLFLNDLHACEFVRRTRSICSARHVIGRAIYWAIFAFCILAGFPLLEELERFGNCGLEGRHGGLRRI